MEPESSPDKDENCERRSRITRLIRDSYTRLQTILPSAYVDGKEVYEALIALGQDVANPALVGEALGSKGMRLPVVNLAGQPKHYLPLAVASEKPAAMNLTSQVAAYAKTMREFGQTA